MKKVQLKFAHVDGLSGAANLKSLPRLHFMLILLCKNHSPVKFQLDGTSCEFSFFSYLALET